MSRGKALLIYTGGLFAAPLSLLMPHEGAPGFVMSLLPCGALLLAVSIFLLLNQLKSPSRDMLRIKLVAASVITALTGAGLLAGALFWIFSH